MICQINILWLKIKETLITFAADKEVNKKNDFEIRKKEDSVQKKRQYRSNKDDSSGSDSEDEKRVRKVITF